MGIQNSSSVTSIPKSTTDLTSGTSASAATSGVNMENLLLLNTLLCATSSSLMVLPRAAVTSQQRN